MKLSTAAQFIAKENTPVAIEKTTIYVYPSLTSDMNDSEKTYGYTITKGALDSSTASMKSKLEVFKQYTDSATTTEVIANKYLDHAIQFITDVNNISIVHYCGLDGAVIPNCTQANGDLKATSGVAQGNRRPADITFAKVKANIDFTSLDASYSKKHLFTFYISLRCDSRQVQDGNQNNINLNTFHGPDDWFRTQAAYDLAINEGDSPDEIFDINKNEFANSDAIMRHDTCKKRLEEIAFLAAWPAIQKGVYKELCPTAVDDPSKALRSLKQSMVDPKTGERLSLSVQQYYQAIKNFTKFFDHTKDWPLDVVHHFIENLNEDVQATVRTTFHYDTNTSKKDALSQNQKLSEALKESRNAEAQQLQLKSTIDKHLGNHSMNLQQHINASVAEDALRKYGASSGKDDLHPTLKRKIEEICWGCGSKQHVYARKNVIICPLANRPEIQENAAKKRAEFNERQKQRNKKRKEEQSKIKKALKLVAKEDESKKDGAKPVTLDDLKALLLSSPNSNNNNSRYACFVTTASPSVDLTAEEAKAWEQFMIHESIPPVSIQTDNTIVNHLLQQGKAMEEHDLFTIAAKEYHATAFGISMSPAEWVNLCTAMLISETDNNTTAEPIENNEMNSLAEANVITILHSKQHNERPPLPIKSDFNLPHLYLILGSDTNSGIKISLTYDTAATINVGFAAYHLAIAKAFPSVVKKLIWADESSNYAPLVLSGVVTETNDGKSKANSILPAMIEYYLPYNTTNGSKATLTIALGHNVSVNTILGMSTIKAAKINFDIDSNVFQSSVLDCPPFEIIFKPTSRNVPDLAQLQHDANFSSLANPNENSISSTAAQECFTAVFKQECDSVIAKDSETPADADGAKQVVWFNTELNRTYD